MRDDSRVLLSAIDVAQQSCGARDLCRASAKNDRGGEVDRTSRGDGFTRLKQLDGRAWTDVGRWHEPYAIIARAAQLVIEHAGNFRCKRDPLRTSAKEDCACVGVHSDCQPSGMRQIARTLRAGFPNLVCECRAQDLGEGIGIRVPKRDDA
jgi:hypothetical protein